MTETFALRSRRVLLPGAADPQAAQVLVRAGKIAAVVGHDDALGMPARDLGDAVLMPGLVDTHVHLNEPGRTEWEGFQTATAAAAAGGITTLVDMPLNSIPATTTLLALKTKQQSAEGNASVDYGLWGGVVPGNAGELEPMVRAGALGFKCFLIDSGVPEFPHVTEKDLREAMPILARLGVPVLVHAELEGPAPHEGDASAYTTYLRSRPAEWEIRAVRLMIALARETRCRVHIVHLSAAGALDDLRRAKADGVPVTVETCPHYLHFAAEEIRNGATQFKCAPPIRERANREALWAALAEGTIDFVVSDHSPCLPALKKLEAGDFQAAWGGISGLQFSLSVMWTEMRKRGIPVARIAELMSARTAKFLGLDAKGALVPGADADLVVWEPKSVFTLDESRVRHRHSLTPYLGESLQGLVRATWVRGEQVYDGREVLSRPGRLLKGANS